MGYSAWIPLGAPAGGLIGGPTTISRNPDVCNVYARGADNALWQRAYWSGQWGGWQRHADGGVLHSRPTLGSMGPDHEHVFARGQDGQVWQKWWTAGAWGGWIPLGAPPGGFVGGPTTISRNAKVCNLYVRGADNALWQRAYANSQWGAWFRHNDGGLLSDEPALDSMGPDHEHVFVRGQDGHVWQKWWTAAAGWSAWISLGAPAGGVVGPPAAISRSATLCAVYARGADHRLWRRTWSSGAWGHWSLVEDDQNMMSATLQLAGPPTLGTMASDHEQVFVVASDGQVWQKWFREAAHTVRFHLKTLTPPAGVTTQAMVDAMRQSYERYGIRVEVASTATISPPQASLLTDIDVGGCTSNSATDEQRALFSAGIAQWSGWIPLDAPAVISRNAVSCNIYARGADNALWQRAYSNGSWSPWFRLDGRVLSSRPAVGTMGPDHEHVFARGQDGQIWQKWWTAAAGWSAWTALGAPSVGFVDAPTTISRNSKVCNLYARGADNALWQRAYSNAQWSAWFRHNDGGLLAAEPALGSMGPDHEHIFVRGQDGQVWQKWWTAASGWSAWTPLGQPPGGFLGAPSTVSRNSKVCNIYVRGADNALWQRAYWAGAWRPWERHDDDGRIASVPAPDSMTPDREHIFARGTDGQVWQKWWMGETRDNEIVVFMVRSTLPALNGCAAHPSGQPGAVVASFASPWTLAHEVGHVFDLRHLSSETCSNPVTALMTGCGTSLIVDPPPELSTAEINKVRGHRLIIRR